MQFLEKIPPTVLAAMVMGSVLLSGFSTMNVIHHEDIPRILTEQAVVTISSRGGLLSLIGARQIDIRMNSTIESEESVRDVIRVLQEASRKDIVIMHMAGFGGEVDTVMDIIDNMKACKAHVSVIVEAPVYSGHAFISISGDDIKMLPYTYLMFHTSSAYGTDCSKADPINGYNPDALDRTVPNKEHCQAGLDAGLALINKWYTDAPYLTGQEKVQILTGHDVYITAADLSTRTK